MIYGEIPGIKKKLSRLVHGTVMLREDELEAGFKLLDDVYAAGCRTWDVANIYGGGQCERVLGRWIEARGIREEAVILTKGAHHNKDRKRVTPFDISTDLHDSFARLRTDYIDLYVLHRDDPALPVGPIVEILNEYHAAGRIHVFGGSNWAPERIAEANEYAEKHGLQKFVVSSPNFSLAQEYDTPWADCLTISGPDHAKDRAWYAEQKMPLFTWSSLAGGFLSGRVTRANWDTVKEDLPEHVVRSYGGEENFERLDRAGELAKEKGLTVPQIGLAYVVGNPGLDVYPLTGTPTGAEYVENAKALEIELTPEEVEWLDLRRETR